MKEKIAATLITYNRLDLLKELIRGIRSQTRPPDEIIVVDNSSSDGSGEWLAKQKDLTLVTQPNVGSSGGQYAAIKTAYSKGYDWIWTMDDDVEPEPECLEKLMEKEGRGLIRAPLRITPDARPYFNDAIAYNLTKPLTSFWKGLLSEKDLENEYIRANGITFEGPLFHRSIVEKIGLPEKKFFIYGDDTEYFIRAEKAGAEIVIVRDARLKRKLPAPDAKAGFTWKHYYVIRNIIAIDVLHGSRAVRYIRPFAYLLSWLRRCRGINDVKTTFRAFAHGYFYKSEN